MISPEIPSPPPGIIHLTPMSPTSHRSHHTDPFTSGPRYTETVSPFLPRMLIPTCSPYKNSSRPFKIHLNITYFNRSILTLPDRFRNSSSILPITPHMTLHCCDCCCWWSFFKKIYMPSCFTYRPLDSRRQASWPFVSPHIHTLWKVYFNWNVYYIGPKLGVNPLKW